MTPGARVAAAAELLDRIAEGEAAERALTTWARASRFAGSKDRRAVRDHVYDALRRWRSLAWVGGAETGRARMIGALRLAGRDPGAVFTGSGHAPSLLTPGEASAGRDLDAAPEAVRLDQQDWVWSRLREDHGERAAGIAEALRGRAGVHLRVNLARADREAAIRALAAEGIAARPLATAATALEVTGGAARVARSRAFGDGLVELQDAASQAVVEALPQVAGGDVLDFCAGGGGKALALAALGARVVAHDADPARMRDIPVRAARAGVADRVTVATRAEGRFDLVLADAPCSGSGAWRRQPEAKWRLTPNRLAELNAVQDAVLDAAAKHVVAGGTLAYATCSVLACENGARVRAWLRQRSGWRSRSTRQWLPAQDGDGFHLTMLERV